MTNPAPVFERIPEPRSWQKLALDAWVRSAHRGIAEIVTGGGKTIFSMLCMQEVINSGVADSVLIIVPTIALLDQWYVALREELGLPEVAIALWSGRQKPSTPGAINIMVVNTARSAVEELPSSSRIFLVVDECHRIGSPANARVISRPYAATLGMSATPDNAFNDRLSTILEPYLGPVFYRYSLDEAFRDGILARYDLVNVRLDLLSHEQEAYDRWTSRIRRYVRRNSLHDGTDESLELLLRRRAAVSAKAALRVPVAVKLVEANRGARTILFHEYVSGAEEILSRLRKRGHSATIYHSTISPGMRRDNLRLFRRGQFDVLVTCRALDEGINIPEVQVAVIASATASSRQRVQRLGRVLRPAPGKTHATVYTLYATEPESDRLIAEARVLKSANSVTWQQVKVARG